MVFLERFKIEIDPDRRLVVLPNGDTRSLTHRELQAFKAIVAGATSIPQIAKIMSDFDAVDDGTFESPRRGQDTVTALNAGKLKAILNQKLGGIIPAFARGRKKIYHP